MFNKQIIYNLQINLIINSLIILYFINVPFYFILAQESDNYVINFSCKNAANNLRRVDIEYSYGDESEQGFKNLFANSTTTLANGIPEEILNFPKYLLIKNISEQNAAKIRMMSESELKNLIKNSIYVGSNFPYDTIEEFMKIKKENKYINKPFLSFYFQQGKD